MTDINFEKSKQTTKVAVAKILEEFEKIAHEAWSERYPQIKNERLETVFNLGLFLEFQRALSLKYGVKSENQFTRQPE